MIYLICQDWYNTSNNHAGIKYLCKQLENMYPENFKCIVFPDFNSMLNNNILSNIHIYRSIVFRYAKLRHKFYQKKIFSFLKGKVTSSDRIILMEYLDMSYPMYEFAYNISHKIPNVNIYGMVHLVPEKIESNFNTKQELEKWLKPITKILTLGHSLTEYFIKRGVDESKIMTTFHYVDSFYYNESPIRNHKKIKVIAMGNQMRNITLLKKIVIANSDVDFIICQGVVNMSQHFKEQKNVKLIPFVEEELLRQYMQEADISLNVMKDTIGSNVIVTSLAMGLAMICSEVGSIKDYCDETNTIFCDNKNTEDFSNAISFLRNNPDILKSMQQSAANKAKEYSIEQFANYLIKVI